MGTNKAMKRAALAAAVLAAMGAVALGIVASASPAVTIPAHHGQVVNQTEVRRGQLVSPDLLVPVSQRGAQDDRIRIDF